MNIQNAGEILKMKTGNFPWVLEVYTLPKITSKKHEAEIEFIRAFDSKEEVLEYIKNNKKEILKNDRQSAHIRELGEGL